ncbi:MAG TPA: hypothetical protein PLS53_00220 [Thermoanaerobaculaceae bacterium]|nr:hypothetical protein [Thermoanaerobaculaceae bacterium]
MPTLTVPGSNGRAVQNLQIPWLDYASTVVPTNHELILWWAQYLWLTDGNFRAAFQRVAEHFITTVEFPELEEDEESEFKDLFFKHLNYRRELKGIGDDFLCFHGDTRAVTRKGVFKLRDLAGQTVDVLSQGGKYRKAHFKSFGRQELLEVTFSDGRTVLATPEHQWIVAKSNGGTIKVPTTKLAGRRIERTVAPRPEQGDEFREGVRHGFVFGDGSTYNKGKKTLKGVANFYGAKDAEMMPFFEGHGNAPLTYTTKTGGSLRKIQGLPAHYKQLPSPTASAEYWYGFVAGFTAADGTVDTTGCVVLAQQSRATLEAIAEQLPRIGMVAGPVQTYDQVSDFREVNDNPAAIFNCTISYVTLLKRFMQPADLLMSHHRARFEQKRTDTNYGKFIGVKSVKPTGIVDEVFCCVEHETHSFVLENGVLTGNCYGNVFVSIYLPFKRHLACQKCAFEQPIKHVLYECDLDSTKGVTWKRKKACPVCGDLREFSLKDRKDPDISRVRLVKYSPFEIEIAMNHFSQRKDIFWKIPNDVRADIQSKARIHIEDTPIEVLEAVARNGRLLFDDDMIFHLDETIVSGMRTRGWGLPRSVSNFRAAWLQQITNRADQAIASDYTLGMRLISPSQQAVVDPMIAEGMDSFVTGIGRIVEAHRAEPMSYHTAPYPVNYQFMGGEGKDLLPADKLKFRQQEFLSQCSIPLEYHQMTLSTQAAPMALRLFESAWSSLPSMYSSALQWITKVVARNFGLQETAVQVQKSTIADDQERKNILMQLMSANQISPQTALAPLGIEASKEARKVFKYQDFIAKLTQEQQDKQMKDQEMGALSALAGQATPSALLQQQQQGAGGGAPPPGAPMGGAPAGGIPGAGGGAQGGTLQQMADQAEQIAAQLVQMPEFDRKGQLKALREGNKDLHALVTSKMTELRRSAASQGQQQLLAPQPGGPPAGGG